jgi:cob(I)alamin adenosyltransferase
MGKRLSKIITRTGDKGTTGLSDGSRVAKDDARIEAMGEVDELNSLLGVLLTHDIPEPSRAYLSRVQHELFDLGGELSLPGHSTHPCLRSRNSSCRAAPLLLQPVT